MVIYIDVYMLRLCKLEGTTYILFIY